MDQQDKTSRTLSRLYLILCVCYVMWAAWNLTPEHQRTEWRLRLLRSCALATSRAARHTAAGSMRRELATGDQLYSVPLWLALCRAALDRAYDAARDVTT